MDTDNILICTNPIQDGNIDLKLLAKALSAENDIQEVSQNNKPQPCVCVLMDRNN